MNSLPETSQLQGPRRMRAVSGVVLAVYWLVIFFGTHWPRLSLERFPRNSDKVLHFGAYAGLSFLLGLWISTKHDLRARGLLSVVAVTYVYAILDELTQLFVPGRSCDAHDVAADWAGSLVGLAVFLLTRRIFRKSREAPTSG